MSKLKTISITILFVVLILTTAFLTAEAYGSPAYAEVDLDSVVIETQPQSINVIYGEEKGWALKVVLSDDTVICRYAWYKGNSTSATFAMVYENSGTNIVFPISTSGDSGYYFCKITSLSDGTNTLTKELVSDTVRVTVNPKAIPLKTPENKTYVYNGSWQTYEIYADKEEVLEGDVVNVIVECEKTTKNAGRYTLNLRLDNANYTIDGENVIEMVIKKAPLEIGVKEVIAKAGSSYEFEITYSGFVNGEDKSVFTREPIVENSFMAFKKVGEYGIFASGAEGGDNYEISYVAGKLYLTKTELTGTDVSGFDGSVTGSFLSSTRFSLSDGGLSGNEAGFFFLKPISDCFELKFDGKVCGDTYTVNINDYNTYKFGMAVCYVDKNNVSHAVKGYTYEDNVLKVTLPTEYTEGYIVVYHNFILLTAIGGLIILVILIMVIVILKDKKKYKLNKKLSEIAKQEADRFRYNSYD